MGWDRADMKLPRRTGRWIIAAGCRGVLLLVTLACAPSFGRADDVADFYRGRTINVYIGVNVGGGYDFEARLLARFMKAHIPGNPTLVPQNMIGAGGIKMANYMYSIAPQDGTAIGMFPDTLIAVQAVGVAGRAIRCQQVFLARFDRHQPADLGCLAHHRRADHRRGPS